MLLRKCWFAIYSHRMSRTKKPKVPTPLAFRFSASLLESIDALVERMNAENPHGPRWTRADIVREVLAGGVPRWVERGHPPWADDPSGAA